MTEHYMPWVKRLGQWHLYSIKDHKNLCGQPALGNNYAEVIKPCDRTPCKECFAEADRRLKADKS